MGARRPSLFLILIIVLGIVSIGLAAYVFLVFLPQMNALMLLPPAPLSERDMHGCSVSLGYSWCASTNRCVRRSDEPCESIMRNETLENIALAISRELPLWQSYWETLIPGFSVQKFRETGRGGVRTDEQSFPSIYRNDTQGGSYRALLVYAPDRKHFIDPYANHVAVLDDGTLRRTTMEPDSDVWVGDVIRETAQRVNSCGTPCDFDDGAWLSNGRFIIVGYSEYYPSNGESRCVEDALCTFVPVVYLYDLADGSVVKYEGPETATRPSGYLALRFPDMPSD